MKGSSVQNVHGKGMMRTFNDQHHREEDDENDPKGNRQHTNKSCGNLCSPPDFDLSTFDDEVANNSDSITKINNSTTSSSIPSHLSIRRQKFPLDKSKKNKHHERRFSSDRIRSLENQKQSRWRDIEQRDISATNSRIRRHRDTNGKRGIPSSQGSNISKNQRLSQPTKSATRSIVGLRPTHWVRDAKPVQQRNSSSTGTNSFQRLAKASALVAATRPNRRLKEAKSNRKNHVDNFGHGAVPVNNTRCRNSSPIEKNDATETPFEKKRPSSEPTKPSFSFAPSFVPTKVSALADDAIGDDSGDECRVVATSMNNSFASTPPFKRRRRSKAATGEWVRRLACLRNMHNNDSARLQNKAFTRHRMLLDVNDPRKRAKTYTDVTILGQYLGPWINVPEDTRVTVLGYAHRHVLQIKNCTDKGRYNDRQQLTQNRKDAKAFSEDFFAWFTFTVATARRIELQQGCKLRIYNAIILPCRLPMALDIPPTSLPFLGNKIGTNRANRCDRTVICTHLCERIASFNEK